MRYIVLAGKHILDVEEEGPAREDDIDSVDVTIRRDLLHERVDVPSVVGTRAGLGDGDFNSTHDLASREGKDVGVVGGDSATILLDLGIEGGTSGNGIGVFGGRKEEAELLTKYGLVLWCI